MTFPTWVNDAIAYYSTVQIWQLTANATVNITRIHSVSPDTGCVVQSVNTSHNSGDGYVVLGTRNSGFSQGIGGMLLLVSGSIVDGINFFPSGVCGSGSIANIAFSISSSQLGSDGNPVNPPSDSTCNCTAEIAALKSDLQAQIDAINAAINSHVNQDLAGYLLKSELVQNIDDKKNEVVSSLMAANTWEEIRLTIDLKDYIQT